MKKILLIACFSLLTVNIFSQMPFRMDVPLFGLYDYTQGEYKNNASLKASSIGIGFGFDIFPKKSYVGVYFRGAYGFPFSLEMNELDIIKNYKSAFAWKAKVLLGPVLRFEPLPMLSINIALAAGVDFTQIVASTYNFYGDFDSISEIAFIVPLVADVAIKFRPSNNFFITVGSMAQFSMIKIPMDNGDNSQWSMKNLDYLFGFTPYVGIGFTIDERRPQSFTY